MSCMHDFTFSSSLFCLVLVSVLSSTMLINELHMAYSEIMKILLKVTAVKTVGKLLLADFMAVVCTLLYRETAVLILLLGILQRWIFSFCF